MLFSLLKFAVTADIQQMSNKDVLPDQQAENPYVAPKDSEPPNIKEEQEDLWSEDEEKPQSLEGHGENCGGSQPARDSSPRPHLHPPADDMQPLLLIKEEILPEQQEWNLNVHQEDIKDEKQKRPGQQLHQMEKADIVKMPFTAAVPVKSENDEKPRSRVHQSQSDDSRNAEPVASSSMVHRTLTAQTDGEDYGGLQRASTSDSYCRLHSDASGQSSDGSETDDSCDWKQTGELHSGFNCKKNCSVTVHHSRGNTTKTQFHLSEEACGQMNNLQQNTGKKASKTPFSCPVCEKKFGLKGSLITHARTHTGEKPFGCSVCSKRFGRKSILITHMRIHTGEKPFGCSECGKTFGKNGSLITHMRVHTGEKPFGCAECGKTFGHNSDLNKHMRIHTGQKPFGCPECGQRFGRNGNLITHMRVHTGEKPFSCPECDKRFGQKGHLITHIRVHKGEKPYACSECSKRFGGRSHLVTHMRIHTGEKPFHCSECGKRFGQKGNLMTHMRMHKGQKPFRCSECGKTFGHKCSLIIHTRIHAGEKINK
ncbi:gastrula zinc finger protein XlCGF57.1-like [Thalassophryne amazonica]|uniref:gastrula zinc finger protein XlCGF57.1-like n=1 Tax=Thalassophryne amazonica TaxID=390379 RepID=UPI001470FF5E|nr:gastrula zinc finger protein XlCGF57.1-like [Thalassophryne amazonica]